MDSSGSTLISGFDDGVLRVLQLRISEKDVVSLSVIQVIIFIFY